MVDGTGVSGAVTADAGNGARTVDGKATAAASYSIIFAKRALRHYNSKAKLVQLVKQNL